MWYPQYIFFLFWSTELTLDFSSLSYVKSVQEIHFQLYHGSYQSKVVFTELWQLNKIVNWSDMPDMRLWETLPGVHWQFEVDLICSEEKTISVISLDQSQE